MSSNVESEDCDDIIDKLRKWYVRKQQTKGGGIRSSFLLTSDLEPGDRDLDDSIHSNDIRLKIKFILHYL